MFKSKYDILFGFCITFMIILAVYLGFERTHQNNLENYLLLLKEKISDMVAEEDMDEFDAFFSDLVKGLRNNSVSQSDVQQLAENLVEIRKEKSTFSREDLKNLLVPLKSDSANFTNVYFFDYLGQKEWQKLASSLENSFAMCDSFRIKRNSIKKIYRNLEKQMDLHARVSEKIRQNSQQALEKFEHIKQKVIDSEIEIKLVQEIERLKQENSNIQAKLSRLDAMQINIDKKREKLHKLKQKMDSLQTELM